MKTKDYVIFEVAKILKEKGYNIPSKHYYRNDSDDIFESNWFLYNKQNYDSVECIAPPLYDAQKWLRDECGIDIEVTVYSQNRDYIVDIRKDTHLMILDEVIIKRSYEEALNEGIRESLKFIKNESE